MGTGWSSGFLPTQAILWFYSSMIYAVLVFFPPQTQCASFSWQLLGLSPALGNVPSPSSFLKKTIQKKKTNIKENKRKLRLLSVCLLFSTVRARVRKQPEILTSICHPKVKGKALEQGSQNAWGWSALCLVHVCMQPCALLWRSLS